MKGRPPIYPALLAAVPADNLWHPIRYGHKTITAPSGLRKRFPGWDFQMDRDDDGTYTVLARRL